MKAIQELITEIQRLRIEPDEVLVVRPKGLLTSGEAQVLKKRLAEIGRALGWGLDRIVVLDRDFDLSVVKASQLALGDPESIDPPSPVPNGWADKNTHEPVDLPREAP